MRRRYQDAEGVEGVRIGEGCPHPQATRGSRERRELPRPGPEDRTGRRRIFITF